MSDGEKPVIPEKGPGAVSSRKVVGAALAGAAIGALAVKTALARRPCTKPEVLELTSYLLEHLGRDVTAYLAGVEPPVVEGWTTGSAEPEPLAVDRLRFAC